ncbi:LysR family transcriptional regulator [uncultured Friedmanniella sp.]|uniref:LysR family transcriptional regulator n=1 Tax=uncultured Friedmanniella sp. TaxID=335381 RepID=UPI0035CA5557
MANLDLNLLTTLHAVLQERSVTRAAHRLGLTQPTVSGTLARLRRHFNDELLYRSGNAYQLTTLGMHLAERTGLALDEVHRVLVAQPLAEPASSTREFVVVTSDYGAAVVGPALSADLLWRAPHASLHLRQISPGPFATDLDRLRAVDGVLMPHGWFHDAPHLDVFRDRWVCLVDGRNRTVGEELTVEDLDRLPWASLSVDLGTDPMGMRSLVEAGVNPRVQTVVNSFLALPLLVPGTDRIAMVPERVARAMPASGLRVLECPVSTGPLVVALWWHPQLERDAEHIWLRERIAAVGASLEP